MASSKHRGVKILKLADGRHVARYRDPITRKQKQQSLDALGHTNAKARERWAIAKLKALQAQRSELAITHGTSMPVRVAITRAQTDYLARYESPATINSKRPPLANVAAFLAKMGILDVVDITKPAIAAYGDYLRRPANPNKKSTANLHLRITATWLRWCSAHGMLAMLSDDDIKKQLRREKVGQDPITILSPKQLRQLLIACLAHDRNESVEIAPLVLATCLSGCRYAEVAGLTWAEVDQAEQVIRLSSDRVKTRQHRVVTLAETPTAMRLFEALALRGRRGRIFPHIARPTAETARRRLIRDYDAPAEWSWHVLRRTCGSLLVCGGVYGNASTFRVAKRLGHSVAVAEKHYLGSIVGLPKDCETLEQAAGMQDEADAIVSAVAVVAPQAKVVAQ